MLYIKSNRIEQTTVTAIWILLFILTGCTEEKHVPKEEVLEQTETIEKEKLEPTPTLKSTLEKYSLEFYGNESPTYFTIAKQGDALKTRILEEPWNDKSKIQLTKLADSGQVFVIVEQSLENNHYVYHFFNCANNLKKETTLDNGYLPLALEDSGGKEGKIIKAYDWWDKESGARAIAPEIYLVWTGSKLEFDKNKMKTLRPTNKEIKTAKRSFRKEALSKDGQWPTTEFEDFLLTLIYSGNEREAERILNYCWAKKKPGKTSFWKTLKSKLSKSQFFEQIKTINGT